MAVVPQREEGFKNSEFRGQRMEDNSIIVYFLKKIKEVSFGQI